MEHTLLPPVLASGLAVVGGIMSIIAKDARHWQVGALGAIGLAGTFAIAYRDRELQSATSAALVAYVLSALATVALSWSRGRGGDDGGGGGDGGDGDGPTGPHPGDGDDGRAIPTDQVWIAFDRALTSPAPPDPTRRSGVSR